MTTRRARGLLALVCVVLVVGAGPAVAADPPKPTNFRSEILEIDPPLPEGVQLEVVGGDAFLQLTVAPGHEVVVPDYGREGEDATPYLRFAPTGVVTRNVDAVATAANERRYGQAPPEAGEGPRDAARFEEVATDGTFAWHDHRIHWMSPTPPRGVGSDGRVDLGGADGTWSVPLIVDGTPTVATGRLWLEDAPPMWPWLILAGVVGVLGYLLARSADGRVICGATLLVGIAALAVSWATWRGSPPDAGASIIPMIVAAVAVVESVVGVVVRQPRVQLISRAAAAAALLGWSLTRLSVLSHAVLPTTVPAWTDRLVTVVALGVGAAAAALLAAPRPALRRGERDC